MAPLKALQGNASRTMYCFTSWKGDVHGAAGRGGWVTLTMRNPRCTWIVFVPQTNVSLLVAMPNPVFTLAQMNHARTQFNCADLKMLV